MVFEFDFVPFAVGKEESYYIVRFVSRNANHRYSAYTCRGAYGAYCICFFHHGRDGEKLFFVNIIFPEEFFHGVVVKPHVVFHLVHVGIVQRQCDEEEHHKHYQSVLMRDDYYGG